MKNETPFFFVNGACRLFGMLHGVEKESPVNGYVLCYPFAEERLWAQRVYVDFARELSRRGDPVLRFDYTGNGDSEGNFEEADVETWLSDIGCAIRMLKTMVPGLDGVGLVGLRFGATLAALAAERNDVARLILWDPIVDGNQYMQEILRSNLMTQTAIFKEIQKDRRMLIQDLMEGKTVNAEGYEIGRRLYEGISDIRLNERNIRCEKDSLIVQIDSHGGPAKKRVFDLGKSIARSSIINVREEPFWREIKTYNGKAVNLCSATLEWMDSSRG